MSEPLLSLHEVSKSFAIKRGLLQQVVGQVHAVDCVSLELFHGETLGLVGESGCGKSTLARMLTRLLPPSTGEIMLQGHNLWDNTPTWLRSLPQRLQMVFQDPFSSLNPRLRVGTSIAEPLIALKLSAKEKKERVAETLESVGLNPSYAERYPHEFSGGQRQRVAIARALITRPACIVCDEAVSALDASVQAQVLNVLKDIQERFGFSCLFISHALPVVGYMSTRVAVMYLGRIVESASRETLFKNPKHPYTQALMNAAPRMLVDPQKRVRSVLQGELPSPLAPPKGCTFHPRCPYAEERCHNEVPTLSPYDNRHFVACHFADNINHNHKKN